MLLTVVKLIPKDSYSGKKVKDIADKPVLFNICLFLSGTLALTPLTFFCCRELKAYWITDVYGFMSINLIQVYKIPFYSL